MFTLVIIVLIILACVFLFWYWTNGRQRFFPKITVGIPEVEVSGTPFALISIQRLRISEDNVKNGKAPIPVFLGVTQITQPVRYTAFAWFDDDSTEDTRWIWTNNPNECYSLGSPSSVNACLAEPYNPNTQTWDCSKCTNNSSRYTMCRYCSPTSQNGGDGGKATFTSVTLINSKYRTALTFSNTDSGLSLVTLITIPPSGLILPETSIWIDNETSTLNRLQNIPSKYSNFPAVSITNLPETLNIGKVWMTASITSSGAGIIATAPKDVSYFYYLKPHTISI